VATESASDWGIRPLGGVTEAIVDCLHSKKPELVDAGYTCLQVFNIGDFGRLDLNEKFQISQNDYIAWTRRIQPRRLDLLISKTGRVGAVAQILDDTPYAYGRNLVLVRPSLTVVDPAYLRFWMLGSRFRQEIQTHTSDGTVLQSLHVKYVPHLVVVVPPLAEQRAIAAILGALDDKIELNRQMNQALEAMAKALFKSWFVDFEPFRDRGMQKSALGLIPTGWRVTELGEVAEVIDCLHSKKPIRQPCGKPLLQLWNIRDDGLIDMTSTFWISEEDYLLWTSRIEAQVGDCVITNVGRVAATAQIPQGLRAALGRNMTAIRCRQSFPFPTFLIVYLRSSPMRNEIVLKTDTGTVLDALNVKDIPRLRLVKPPPPLVERFEIESRPLRERMEKNLAENDTLGTIRDTLLTKLLSGEIRVKDAEKFVEKAI